MATLTIYNTEGKEVGELELDPKVFDGKVNRTAVYQAVVCFQANQRQGTASTKTRGTTRGGGKKPWRQKGTGRARAGSIRSPLWRGGGVVFGPHPRDYSFSIPKKIKKLALSSCLNSKLNDKDLTLLDELKIEGYKTKDFAKILSNLKIDDKVLIVLDSLSENIKRAARNLPDVKIQTHQSLTSYDILKYKKLIITKSALSSIIKRIIAV
jgi:large subunit ribosomal protein L4